jgi:hypothetical protein
VGHFSTLVDNIIGFEIASNEGTSLKHRKSNIPIDKFEAKTYLTFSQILRADGLQAPVNLAGRKMN